MLATRLLVFVDMVTGLFASEFIAQLFNEGYHTILDLTMIVVVPLTLKLYHYARS